MRVPTREQQAVLDSTARVRVVHASPGSGKTWLVSEVINKELEKWSNQTSGIAALSFTRVGGDEIRRAVGYELGHPHFVGTIDAFLFRFVIRPHLKKAYPWFSEPRLIPGEWGAENWKKYSQSSSTAAGKINLFGCVYIGEENGHAVVAHKPHPSGGLQRIVGQELLEVRKGKRKKWAGKGLLTHSDATLWASTLLENPTFGPIIRSEIVKRFPLIVVDEAQDTGHFLGKCITSLLNEPSSKGILVGDPDQAIYEFTGARPELFEAFKQLRGAEIFSLSRSRRCSPKVCAVASFLKDSGGSIAPAEEGIGRAILVRYNDISNDISKIICVFRLNRHPVSALTGR